MNSRERLLISPRQQIPYSYTELVSFLTCLKEISSPSVCSEEISPLEFNSILQFHRKYYSFWFSWCNHKRKRKKKIWRCLDGILLCMDQSQLNTLYPLISLSLSLCYNMSLLWAIGTQDIVNTVKTSKVMGQQGKPISTMCFNFWPSLHSLWAIHW